MTALLRKEINEFFSSLIAYISMAVFFIVLGLNLFVFEGNIFDSNYATLDSFFTLTLDSYVFDTGNHHAHFRR